MSSKLLTEPRIVLDGLAIGESTRWHEGRVWLCNWGAAEVIAVDPHGRHEVIAKVPTSLPFSIDWLPDGRLLVVSGREAQLLRREADGALVAHADLSAHADTCNEIVVDGRGSIYVNGGRGDPMGPDFKGLILRVGPDGSVRQVAEGFAFPNGMAVTPDNATLIIAESHGRRLTAFDIEADGGLANRRVWAELGDGFPDGICVDAEGCVWYADVPNRRCVRVAEGGEVLASIQADRGCFACMLGGADGRTLYIAAAEWRGMDKMFDGPGSGVLLAVDAPAPGAGWP